MYASENRVSIGSDNGLAPGRRQAIIWTNAGALSIGLLGTICSEIRIGNLSFWFNKKHLKLSSAKMAAILSRGRLVKRWLSLTAVGVEHGWVITANSQQWVWLKELIPSLRSRLWHNRNVTMAKPDETDSRWCHSHQRKCDTNFYSIMK